MTECHLDAGTAARIYEQMLLSREVDLFLEEELRKGGSAPHFHSGIGQEALSVAATLALAPQDYLMYSHRGYGQVLSRGLSLYELFADMNARIGGTNDGFGGIMHLYRQDLGIMGRNSVFGTKFTITMGLALSAMTDGDDRVAVCFFGEAEASRGPIYEALNMAALLKLPMVLVAENNGYSYSSRTENMFAGGNMMGVWGGLGIPVADVDGNDAVEVYSAVAGAISHARSGAGPAIVEGRTYRIASHSPPFDPDPTIYRTNEEVAQWRAKDPLQRMSSYISTLGIDFDESTVRSEARAQIELAWAKSKACPSPDMQTYLKQMELL